MQDLSKTIRRVELILDNIEIKEEDETSYNELEFILQELNSLKED